jgi:hypothetical protein
MILKERQNAFVQVGMFIKRHYDQRSAHEQLLHQGLEKVIELAFLNNGWFSPNFVNEAIQSVGSMLDEASITSLCRDKETGSQKTVALICAGNIPLVGFHDLMCGLLSGHRVLLKMSADDNVLMPFFIRLLIHFEPRFESMISIADGKLSGFDAVIATGSNNTSTHFRYYFGKYPNIIRKNRTSIAILTGKESPADLKNLGRDIFLYYGLGCRNVGKLLVPENYDLGLFFENIIDYGFVIDNKKYANNYDYHRALFLLEQQAFLDNNFLIVKESADLHSPVASLYYSRYKDYNETKVFLEANKEQLQCVVGAGHVPFGYSQRPVITDFADNINTYEFLLSL